MKVVHYGDSNEGVVRTGEKPTAIYAPPKRAERLALPKEVEYEPNNSVVLFMAQSVYPFVNGGAEISMHSILIELSNCGYNVLSVSPVASSADNKEREVDGVTAIKTDLSVIDVILQHRPFHIITQLRMSSMVVEAAKLFGIDSTLYVRSAAEHFCMYKAHGKHVCHTGDYVNLLACKQDCFGENRIYDDNKMLFRDATHVVCNSKYMSDAVRRFYGREDVKVQHPRIAEAERMRTGDAIVAVRPRTGKGNVVFEELSRRLPKKKFICLGGHDLHDERLGDNVELVADVDVRRIGEVYARCGILIKPNTDMEAFGRVVPEAGARGIPAICSDIGGLREAIGEGGIMIPLSDAENIKVWVDAVLKIDREYDRYSELAIENAAKFIGSNEVVIGIVAESKSGVGSARKVRLKNAKIKLVCGDFPGIRSALKNLCGVFPEMCEFSDYDPDVMFGGNVIIGGWQANYPDYVRRGAGIYSYTWHSSLSQLEQSGESVILKSVLELIKSGSLRHLFTSCHEFADVVSAAVGEGVAHWLPDTVDLKKYEGVVPVNHGDGLHVDFFMPGHHRKNILPQLVAAKRAGCVVHVNRYLIGRGPYKWFTDVFGIDVIDHGLVPDESYLQVVSGMDVGVQCSFAESFCYYAMERMLNGVPVIGSSIVPVLKYADDMLVSHLIAKDPTDVCELTEKLERLKDAELRKELGSRSREHALGIAKKHNAMAKGLLEKLLNGESL